MAREGVKDYKGQVRKWREAGGPGAQVKNRIFVKTKAGAATFAPIPNAGKAPPAVALGEVAAPQVRPLRPSQGFGSPKRLCPAPNLPAVPSMSRIPRPKSSVCFFQKQWLGGGVFSTQELTSYGAAFSCGTQRMQQRGCWMDKIRFATLGVDEALKPNWCRSAWIRGFHPQRTG